MKILYLSNDDTGGNNYYISQAVNAHTPHESRAIKMMKSYLDYPHDIFKPKDDEIVDWYRWADIVHIRNGWQWIPSRCTGKPTVITFTNVSYRNRPGHYTKICRSKKWFATVSTLDLVKHNNATWIPNPRPDMLPMAWDNKHERFTVCHSPTKRGRKGTETIIKAVRQLPEVDLELIEKTPYAKCLERRAKCHLTIDQFDHGYGNSAIEAWAMGQPVISQSRRDPDVSVLIKKQLGELPWMDISEDVDLLRDAISFIVDDGVYYRELREIGYEWWHEHHSERAVAKKVISVYEGVLNGRTT